MSDIKKSVGKAGLGGLLNRKPKPQPTYSRGGGYNDWRNSSYSTGRSSVSSVRPAKKLIYERRGEQCYVPDTELLRVAEKLVSRINLELNLCDLHLMRSKQGLLEDMMVELIVQDCLVHHGLEYLGVATYGSDEIEDAEYDDVDDDDLPADFKLFDN